MNEHSVKTSMSVMETRDNPKEEEKHPLISADWRWIYGGRKPCNYCTLCEIVA
jgi:hypothetical protein